MHLPIPVSLAGLLLLGVVVGGCASKPPQQLGAAIADAPSTRSVQQGPAAFAGREVLWGGEILAVRNASGSTDVEIYARPLLDNFEPRPDGGDGVRFIARVPRFLDPVEYAPGKRLTVRGRVGAALTRPIGDFPYRYPLVAADAWHLWPAYRPPSPSPWYRDPYWDPWWPHSPWGPWGPYRHPYWW
ncbi:MAG: Slp/YeaY family lipoprotein [Gammaproteobacteria bacterium]|nr:Slp/YeaY family lipoprotein [Gammaproteobacteria bacterium]